MSLLVLEISPWITDDRSGSFAINDSFGHDGGDVLREVAERMQCSIRTTDIVVGLVVKNLWLSSPIVPGRTSENSGAYSSTS